MAKIENDLGWYFVGDNRVISIIHRDPAKWSRPKHIVIATLLFSLFAISSLGIISLPKDSLEKAFFLISWLITTVSLSLYSKTVLKSIIVSVNRKSYSLIINSINNYRRNQQLPCYLFKAELEHTSDSNLYRVYLRPSEFLEIDEPSEKLNPLVWESYDIQEASQILDELCQCGIGDKDFEKQHPLIHRNKKFGLLVLVCYILSFIAMFFYLFIFIRPELINNPDSIKPILHLIQAFLIFIILSIIAYAGYRIWFGLKVIKHRQIPPPTKIRLFSTKLFQGEKAVRRGRNMVILALITIIISLIGAIYFDYKLHEMFPSQDSQETLTTSQNQ